MIVRQVRRYMVDRQVWRSGKVPLPLIVRCPYTTRSNANPNLKFFIAEIEIRIVVTRMITVPVK